MAPVLERDHRLLLRRADFLTLRRRLEAQRDLQEVGSSLDDGETPQQTIDPHGFGLTERANSLENADFKVSSTNSGGKGPESPMGAGVRISHDHRITWPDETFLREQRMAYSVITNIKKIRNILAPGPIAKDLGLGGSL